MADLLRRYHDDLPAIFGVSQVGLEPAAGGQTEVVVSVHKADGIKCERCWRYVPSVSDTADFKGLCERCVDALSPPQLGRAS
jgi:isoleucyl-tRNA synthetase